MTIESVIDFILFDPIADADVIFAWVIMIGIPV